MEITTKKVKLSAIRLNPENPRTISKKDMDLLVKSLADFPEMMELREIVVDETMTCLGGNMRTLALRKAGAKDVTAKIVTGLTPKQKREFVIKDNSNFGKYDMDLLSSMWSDLPLIDWGVDLPDDWMKEPPGGGGDAPPQIDRAEELNKTWGVKSGDLWQIGEHRLLCGDSTKAEDVERVMGGEKADMVLADPPYGIGYAGSMKLGQEKFGWRQYAGGWDETRPDNKAILSIIEYAPKSIIWGGNFFPCLPVSAGWLVWNKVQRNFSMGEGELAWTNFLNSIRIFDLSRAECLADGKEHPTQKATALIQWCLGFAEADVVIDPFLGSGTTMVACQNLNRKCRGIEISENYCAVILQRMTDAFPGIEIRRVE